MGKPFVGGEEVRKGMKKEFQNPSRYLNISHNLLLDLPRSGFIGMETLESLDLSHNDLRIVDKRAFEKPKV